MSDDALFNHDRWLALTDDGRRVAIDRVLEQLGAGWELEGVYDQAGFPVAYFTHAPTSTRFLLVPGGRFVAGWTADDSRRLSIEVAKTDWGTVDVSDFTDRGQVDVAPFLMALRPLEPWALVELIDRPEALEVGGTGGVIRPQYLRLAIERLEARGWRIPSEDEWEFAVRGGTRALFPDGIDAIPRYPLFAVNPLGLLNCGESAEIVRARNGQLKQRGGSALYFPWQGPNWVISMCAAPSRPIEEFFASLRPVVALPLARSSEPRPSWSRPVGLEVDRIAATGPVLPEGLPDLLTDLISLESSELDLRQLLVLGDDEARRFAQRLALTRADFDPERRERNLRQVLALIAHPGTKERGRLLGWFVREASKFPDAVELWQLEMSSLRKDPDPGVRAAAAWVLEPQLFHDDDAMVALTVALTTFNAGRSRPLREQLSSHPDALVRATAGNGVHEALASGAFPHSFPFPARLWFDQMLTLAAEPIEPFLERRVARACVTLHDRELRDLAAATLMKRNFGFSSKRLKTLTVRQGEILELVRAHGACVRLYEHGVSLFGSALHGA